MPRYETFYNKYNLTCTDKGLTSKHTFAPNKIKEQIQSGGYVILYVRGENHGEDGISKYGRDWATAAHWVAILGYRELNMTGEIFVSDSGHGNTGWVPVDEFDGITASVVFVDEK